MRLISCQFSEEYLNDISYISSLKDSFSELGTGWNELPLLPENMLFVPKKGGIFLLVLKDKISNCDPSLYTKTIIFIGGDDQRMLRDYFLDLLSSFNNKAVNGNIYAQEILKFDTRRQCGDLLFSYLQTNNVKNDSITLVIDKLKNSYSPPGNWFHKAKLDHSKMEPAF